MSLAGAVVAVRTRNARVTRSCPRPNMGKWRARRLPGRYLPSPAEWVGAGCGVRVNAVCPGWVKTEMDAADQASGGYTDADIVDRVPMARFAAPGDIAQAVAFLADPARSGFVNGIALPVDGGWTADASWTSLRLRKR